MFLQVIGKCCLRPFSAIENVRNIQNSNTSQVLLGSYDLIGLYVLAIIRTVGKTDYETVSEKVPLLKC
jgi:hypothetical protein